MIIPFQITIDIPLKCIPCPFFLSAVSTRTPPVFPNQYLPSTTPIETMHPSTSALPLPTRFIPLIRPRHVGHPLTNALICTLPSTLDLQSRQILRTQRIRTTRLLDKINLTSSFKRACPRCRSTTVLHLKRPRRLSFYVQGYRKRWDAIQDEVFVLQATAVARELKGFLFHAELLQNFTDAEDDCMRREVPQRCRNRRRRRRIRYIGRAKGSVGSSCTSARGGPRVVIERPCQAAFAKASVEVCP